MAEKIYTIPVNEAFDKKDGCPFCTLYDMLCEREFEILMGGAMMEPDVRIATNKQGFCKKHFDGLLGLQKRLQVGLILESHFSEQIRPLLEGGFLAKPSLVASKVRAAAKDCYICTRVGEKLSKMFDTAVYLYETDIEFRKKVTAQPFFCLNHYGRFVSEASSGLPKKLFSQFYSDISALEKAYAEELNGDVSWYCKKFDYRYKDEDWKNSKDSIERSIRFLCGSEPESHE